MSKSFRKSQTSQNGNKDLLHDKEYLAYKKAALKKEEDERKRNLWEYLKGKGEIEDRNQ